MSRLLTWFRPAPKATRTDSPSKQLTESSPSATPSVAESNVPVLVGDQVARVSGVSASLSATCGTLREQVDLQLGLTEGIRDVSADMEDQALSAQRRIENLTRCSAEIAAIAETISEIAGQTKLLALNASIESARAGEAGRGFAVVATEVGELAARATESTRRISAMAAEIDADTSVASEVMSSLVQAVSENIKGSVSGLVDGLQHTAEEVDLIAGEALSLATQTDEFYEIYGEAALSPELRRLVEAMKGTVRKVEAVFAKAIDTEAITIAELFDDQYQPIPNTNPIKYRTKFDELTDRILPAVQEPLLAEPTNFAAATCIDRNGYIPTHNRFCSDPASGDYEHDLVHSRSKRIFDDEAGRRAATNQKPFLIQTSRRDTGQMIHDIAVPISVGGRWWGNLRCGYEVADLHDALVDLDPPTPSR